MILGKNVESVYSNLREIQRVYSRGKLVWEKRDLEYETYYNTPFTIQAIDTYKDTDTAIIQILNANLYAEPKDFKYSINGGEWKTTRVSVFNLKKDDILQIISKDMYYVRCYGLCDVYGNFMSLVYGDDYIGQDVWSFEYDYIDASLYAHGCFWESDIHNAENLVLPATTMEGNYCYMFSGCKSLVAAPKWLPATTLSPYCYCFMFSGCESLVTAPKILPARTLTRYCYRDMFVHCYNMVTAPVLPAPTLEYGCYEMMFDACISLRYLKCLATKCNGVSWDDCLSKMWIYQHKPIDGTLVCKQVNGGKNPLEDYIPSTWTVQYIGDEPNEDDPEDNPSVDFSITPFTVDAIDDAVSVTLSEPFKYSINGSGWIQSESTSIDLIKNDRISIVANYNSKCRIVGLADISGNICSLIYGDDFKGKTSWVEGYGYAFFKDSDIRNAENLILPATTLTESCYNSMFYNCNKMVSVPKLPATTLAVNCYRLMFYGCSSLTTPPELPATTLTESCYCQMFSACSGLTSAPELPATTLATECYMLMFSYCSGLTSAPELPATTLATECYHGMFWYCGALNHIKCYAIENINDNTLPLWTQGIKTNGTLVCKQVNGGKNPLEDYIPSTWSVEYFT